MILTRFAYLDSGTFGRFTLPDGMTLFTVERPWLDNKRRVSCIPVGEYECRPRKYNRGGYDAIEVCGVWERDYILFHRGNFVRNSQGCILVNSELTCDGDGMRGVNSRIAFDAFMAAMGEGFTLNIVNYEGGKMRIAA